MYCMDVFGWLAIETVCHFSQGPLIAIRSCGHDFVGQLVEAGINSP
jgi:hypothetical protein